jgi:hypothetical protein
VRINLQFIHLSEMCSSAVGLLSEYIKSNNEYDKMNLVVGIAKGVAYLHCESLSCSSESYTGHVLNALTQRKA